MISSGILAHVSPFLLGVAFCVGFTLWIQHLSVILCCVTALAAESRSVIRSSSAAAMNLFIELIVFRYFTLVLIRSTHCLKLILRKATGAAGAAG